MTAVPRIITDSHSLFSHYQDLTKGDIVLGRIRLKPGEEYLLLDLCRRGIVGIPSLISQLCSRSKTMFTFASGEFEAAAQGMFRLRSAPSS